MLDYLTWKKSTTKNPATVKHYEMWVRRFHTFIGTDQMVFGLEDVGRFKKHLQNHKPQPYSPRNIQYGLQLLRDYISYNMTVNGFQFPLKLLKIPQERSKSHPALMYDDFLKMIDRLPLNEPTSLQRRLMLTLLWETGMRGGELLRLKISDLRPRGAIIENEKNHRSRLIGWSDKTDKLLQFYLPLRKQLQTVDGIDWLFVSFHYKPCRKLTTRTLERIVERLRKDLKLAEPVRPHSFRHGFVHRKLKEGKPITTIAQMLGHSSTMNVLSYSQLTSHEIRDAWGMDTAS